MKKVSKKISPFFIAHFLPHLYSEGAKIKGEKIIACFKGRKILDAGSGCGWLSRMALGEKYEVTSVDISEKVIKLEKYFAALSGLPALKIKKASITKLPFKSKTFDTILSSEVLEHIERKDVIKTLGEFNRVLKDDGVIVITVPGFMYGLVYDFMLNRTIQKNKSSQYSYLGFLKTQIPELPDLDFEFEKEDIHKQQFSPQKIKKFFGECGFELTKEENLEILIPLFRSISNLFRFTRNKIALLEKFDAYVSSRTPLFVGTDWLFVGQKIRK